MVRPRWVEHLTFGFVDRRSIQLSYGRTRAFIVAYENIFSDGGWGRRDGMRRSRAGGLMQNAQEKQIPRANIALRNDGLRRFFWHERKNSQEVPCNLATAAG